MNQNIVESLSKCLQLSNVNPIEFDGVKKIGIKNPKNQGNIRDYSSAKKLCCVAISQVQILLEYTFVKSLEQN